MAYNSNSSLNGELDHSIVTLPKPAVHATHPFNNKQNHDRLLQYLQKRLIVGKQNRDSKLNRYVRIDQEVAGWMRMSDEDKKRLEQQSRDGSPQATNMNLPLSFVHIDDMMTYFAATFAPNRGMFYHTGDPSEVGDANQIVIKMNNDAIYAGAFREILLGIYSFLKYNNGGYKVFWSREDGPKLVRDELTQTDKVDMQLRWQGNRLEAIDMYNLLVDPSVHPSKVHIDGEFVAIAKVRSYYWLQNKASQNAFFNCEEALENCVYDSNAICTYYRSPPEETKFQMGANQGEDWVSILSEVSSSTTNAGFELVEISIRLNPTHFGLVPGDKKAQAARSRYEIWRFTILDNKYIIDAEMLNNIHGFLPVFMGVLNDDLMGTSQKSVAEILQPLQSFASFLMNTHLHATRSQLWGLTIYDPSIVDLATLPKGEVNATVPVKPPGFGKPVGDAVYKHSATLETKQTLTDLSALMDIINQFFPTQSLPSQIASIDRAVDSQVAAVQQGANRRQQKAARLLDDMVMRNVRFAMYYNIIQYQPDSEQITDFFTGKPVTLNLASLRNTDLPFIIGQGLKAIDRQAAASMLQQIIFALIQAPAAAQGLDMLGLIDYWTSMIDIDIDMKQFRLAPPQAVPGQDPNAAPQADATGNPIQPATNPQSVTHPIYGRPAPQ